MRGAAPPPPPAGAARARLARASTAPLLVVLLLAAATPPSAATPTAAPDALPASLLEMCRRPVPGNWFITGDRMADYGLLSLLFACVIPLLRRLLCRFVYEPLGRHMIGSAMVASRERREQRAAAAVKGRKPAVKANGAAAEASTTTPRRTTRRSAAAAEADATPPPARTTRRTTSTPAPPPIIPADKMLKWNESAWKMTAFSTLVAVGVYVMASETWMTHPAVMFKGATRLPMNILIKPSLLVSYALQTGFYLQSIPFLLLVEVRRKDFAESMAHHVITVVLLAVSWAGNFTRAGAAFTLLHDVSDIFLEAAKLMRYCRRERAATAAFVAFALSWIALRVFYYPWLVLNHVLLQPLLVVALPNNIDPQPWWSVFATLFTVLYGLHLYWTYLIVMVIVRKFTKGEMDDVREDGSDSDSDGD
jgi:ceramide synthetase